MVEKGAKPLPSPSEKNGDYFVTLPFSHFFINCSFAYLFISQHYMGAIS